MSVQLVGEGVVVVSALDTGVGFHTSKNEFNLVAGKDRAEISFSNEVLVSSEGLESGLDGVGGIRARGNTLHITDKLFESDFAITITINARDDLVQFATSIEVDVFSQRFQASTEFQSVQQIILVLVEVFEAFLKFSDLNTSETRARLGKEFLFENLLFLV